MKRFVYLLLSLMIFLFLNGCAYDKKRIGGPAASNARPKQPVAADQAGKATSGYPQTTAPAREEPRPLDLGQYNAGVEEKEAPQVCELPSMEYVNDRIFEYGRKLERWKELDDKAVVSELGERDSEEMVRCFRDLQKVLNGYNHLRAELFQEEFIESGTRSGISRKEILALQQRDITFLEGSCDRLLAPKDDKTVGWIKREEKADLAQLETLIERYSSNKEYENVIQVWHQIPSQQVDRVHLRTRILYGNALMQLHQNAEAAKVYQGIVDWMSTSNQQPTDIMSLRKVLADLYTASRRYSLAEKQYLEISKDYKKLSAVEEWAMLQLSILERSGNSGPELNEYSDMLKNYLGYDPVKDGEQLVWQADQFLEKYPYSPVASNVDLIRSTVVNSVERWFETFIAEVDQLAAEKKFQEGLVKLETISLALFGKEKQQLIAAKTNDLTLTEAVHTETVKIEKMQELQRQWNEGMLMVDQDRFDEALEVFMAMLDTEYSAKAEDKIREVSLEAAKTDRRKAADLFLRYTKTSDDAARKKLLIESRRQLMDILVKYPNVEITDKVLGNIKRVEQEMNSIDPNLIRQSEMADGQTVEERGTDLLAPLPGTDPAPSPIKESVLQ
ncbi:MAG: hypothetical protein ABFS19_08180 [Thermodesulfobacteriota bacterium]